MSKRCQGYNGHVFTHLLPSIRMAGFLQKQRSTCSFGSSHIGWAPLQMLLSHIHVGPQTKCWSGGHKLKLSHFSVFAPMTDKVVAKNARMMKNFMFHLTLRSDWSNFNMKFNLYLQSIASTIWKTSKKHFLSSSNRFLEVLKIYHFENCIRVDWWKISLKLHSRTFYFHSFVLKTLNCKFFPRHL